MVKRFLIPTFALGALLLVSPLAAAPSFVAHAEMRPSGCRQALVGSLVRLSGCTASARVTGTVAGTLRISYSAEVDIVRGSGSQRGTLTLESAGGKDRLVARYRGVVAVMTGRSHGTWTSILRQGRYLSIAGPTGSYTSRSPDQGVHVSFDVRS